jgi:hypothetical protein
VSLSPAAQAVMEAATENPIIQQDPVYRERIGRALCAAADQVVPDGPYCHEDDLYSDYTRRSERQQTRHKLLAIAAELDGTTAL